MVQNKIVRGRGRPRQFDQDEALDKAVNVFWELGYENADTATLCSAMNLTKPSVYNAFGSKEDLYLKALERYGETIARAPAVDLLAAETPRDAIQAFFNRVAQNVSGCTRPSGCLYGSYAIPAAEKMPKVAAILDTVVGGGAKDIQAYFEAEVKAGTLPQGFAAGRAVALMMDLMTAMGLNGRMGATLPALEEEARRNTDLVWYEAHREHPE